MKRIIISMALDYAKRLTGMGYSRRRRFRLFKRGSADCSSFIYACFLAAGYPLRSWGRESIVSFKQVYAEGFKLLYPKNHENIGQKAAENGFYKSFSWKPGDLIFYNFDIKTRRRNRITHVAMCLDAEHIIHDGNNTDKTCIKDISYGDGNILAVTRLNEEATQQKISLKSRVGIRRMQLLLNLLEGAELNCTGFPGPNTMKEYFKKKKKIELRY